MGIDTVKRVTCERCGRAVNAKLARYTFVLLAERGASKFGNRGNILFGRECKREEQEFCLCGPCSDQFVEQVGAFIAGAGLDSFERTFMTTDKDTIERPTELKRARGLEGLGSLLPRE